MKGRLDDLLVEQGLAPDLKIARSLIIAGKVQVNSHRADKPGTTYEPDSIISVSTPSCPYVSRGGLKLEKGLDFFKIDPLGLICADIGASSGGFTDCLLKKGAALVYAVDVGYGQLDWSLRKNPKVVVMERTNARKLTPADFKHKINLAVVDASFISLKLLVPPLLPLFEQKAAILALIKPQFEVTREEVGEGGVVRDPNLHQLVIDDICEYASSINLRSAGVTASPILGPKGNKEFLVYLQSNS